ncbi:AsmA-like C-terminal region-containing protein [Xanthobacter autotrophicus DSM 431]|uniref:AsmA family protein n=1 Tax=Xanthobacter nonsaccharivorans TaxID=3119912 RepID=UPI003728BAA8
MQGILISLATAVILAIGGAFAAPFVVDWNAWRGTFETEMGRALGLPVVIRGSIDAEILPAPRILLRDVTLGDVVSTGGTVRELKAELSLGALMRGEVQATGVSLTQPQIRIVIDSAGRLALPTGTGRAADLSIARFEVKDGALDLLDRASDHRISLSGLDLKGEARSLSGPFKLDGEITASGARFALRSSLGKVGDDGAGRLRVVLDGRNRPFGLDLDGALNVKEAKPRFEGRATLARHGSDGPEAWQLSATLKASPESVLAESLDLAIGGAATPAQLTGTARLTLGRAIGLDAVLNARSLDLDALRAASGGHDAPAADANPAAALARFLSGVAALPSPDIASRIGLAADQVMFGGTLLRDVRADITGASAGWKLDNGEAQLPGKAALRLSGMPTRSPAGDGFDGSVTFSADDPATFLRWAVPAAPREYVAAVKGPVRISGRISAAPARISVDALDATFAASRMRGSAVAALTPGAAPKLDLKLSLDGFDLDPLVAALQQAAASVGGGADGSIVLDGRNLSLAGLPLRGLSLEAAATGGNWRLTRIVMDDLGGIRLEGAGRMENFSTTPRGTFNIAVSGPKADGLVPLARLLAGDQTAQVLATLAPIAAPVKANGTIGWGEAGGRDVTFSGSLGQISGEVTFARTMAGVPLRVALKADAAEGARALAAFGIDGIGQRLGPAHVDVSVDPLTQGEAQVRGKLLLADMTAQGEGTARVSGSSFEPRLTMRLDGPDLGRILPQAGAAVEGPVPTALAFTLTRHGTSWRLDNLSGSLAAAPLTGSLELEPGALPRLSGKLAFDSLSLPRSLAMFGARAGNDAPAGTAGSFWGAGRLGPPSVTNLALLLDLSASRLATLGPYTLGNARLVIASDGTDLDLRDISGTLGGGRAAASLRVKRQADGVAADGRLVLEQVDASALLAPAAARTPPQGKVNLILDLGGAGRSVLGVVQTLSGQGTLTVRDLVIDGAAPAALDAVLGEAQAMAPPPDERRTAQMLDRALMKGPLRLPLAESTLGIVNGVARLSPARTTVGPVRVGLSGSLDLARLAMDGTLELEGPEAAGGVPGGNIVWRGPLANPERRVGAAPLTSVIALRAIDRETKRLEDRQLGRPVTAPAAPAPVQPAPVVAPVAPPQPEPPRPAPQATAPVTPAPQPAAPRPPAIQTAPAPAPAPVVTAPPAPAAPRPQAPPATPTPAPVPPAPPAAAARPAEPKPTPGQGFGAPTTSGTAGAGTGGVSGAGTSPSTRTETPRQESHATEGTAPATDATRRAPTARPVTSPRRTERAPEAPPPRVFVPTPQESTLPPTRGFGDLPRPPGLVGQ